MTTFSILEQIIAGVVMTIMTIGIIVWMRNPPRVDADNAAKLKTDEEQE